MLFKLGYINRGGSVVKKNFELNAPKIKLHRIPLIIFSFYKEEKPFFLIYKLSQQKFSSYKYSYVFSIGATL